MKPASFAPWLVVAAWAGLMLGVGAAVRPDAPVALSTSDAAARIQAWAPLLAETPSGTAGLWIGETDCVCDADSVRQLADWARESGLPLQTAPGMTGVALADAQGDLRYAGEAGALLTHCGGLRGFQAWWQGPASRPILTAACSCA